MVRVLGKVAMVTGAGSGIGRATAELLAREGASVVVTDIDPSNAAKVCKYITANGGDAFFLQQDVSEEKQWQQSIETVLKRYSRLDVLVNNAAIQVSKSLDATSLEDWRKVFRINMEGVFLGTRIALTTMKEQTGGSIINLSSTMSTIVNTLSAAYSTSKAAVSHFTKAAALEGAASKVRVRVNSVHPGVIRTDMVEREIADMARQCGAGTDEEIHRQWENLCPLGMGEPADVAYGILFLASDESRYVTGAELVIDGGHIIGRRRMETRSESEFPRYELSRSCQ